MTQLTPFDTITKRLRRMSFQENRDMPPEFSHILNFVVICRICYLEMMKTSEPLWNLPIRIPGKEIGIQEILKYDTIMAKSNMAYFNFIGYLSRYGQLFDKKYFFKLPLLERIIFYRNKAVEHWGEYESLFFIQMQGQYFIRNKIAIPCHLGTVLQMSEGEETFVRLLKKLDIKSDYPKFEDIINPEARSHVLFSLLETFSDGKMNKKGVIKDEIVNILFELGFPLPFHCVEDYIDELLHCLEENTKINEQIDTYTKNSV